MSENGWVVQKLCAMKFAKSRSTKWVKIVFLEKDRFFSSKKKVVQKKFSLPIGFPQSGLSFEYHRFPSTYGQTEKIEKWGRSTRKWTSVCHTVFWTNRHRKRERETRKIYHSKEHFRLYKMDYSLLFFPFSWSLENFDFLAHLAIKYDFFTVWAS